MSEGTATGFSYRGTRRSLIPGGASFDKTFLHRIATVSTRAIRAD